MSQTSAKVIPFSSQPNRSSDQGLSQILARQIADEVLSLIRAELRATPAGTVQPALFDVRQAAVYLGRTEQSIQHLIFQKDLPVVRHGRRVHLHRDDLDRWIEQHKY